MPAVSAASQSATSASPSPSPTGRPSAPATRWRTASGVSPAIATCVTSACLEHGLGVARVGPVAVGVPPGHDDEHRVVGRVGEQVPQQQERGPVGPLQVVEHQQHRAAGGDGRQPVAHGVEQAPALGVGVVGERRPHPAEAGGHVGQQAGQLVGVGAHVGLQQRPGTGGGVGAERLADGLVGGEAVLVPAAVEDGAAARRGPAAPARPPPSSCRCRDRRPPRPRGARRPGRRPRPPPARRSARPGPRPGGRWPAGPSPGSTPRRRRPPRSARSSWIRSVPCAPRSASPRSTRSAPAGRAWPAITAVDAASSTSRLGCRQPRRGPRPAPGSRPPRRWPAPSPAGRPSRP